MQKRHAATLGQERAGRPVVEGGSAAGILLRARRRGCRRSPSLALRARPFSFLPLTLLGPVRLRPPRGGLLSFAQPALFPHGQWEPAAAPFPQLVGHSRGPRLRREAAAALNLQSEV